LLGKRRGEGRRPPSPAQKRKKKERRWSPPFEKKGGESAHNCSYWGKVRESASFLTLKRERNRKETKKKDLFSPTGELNILINTKE